MRAKRIDLASGWLCLVLVVAIGCETKSDKATSASVPTTSALPARPRESAKPAPSNVPPSSAPSEPASATTLPPPAAVTAPAQAATPQVDAPEIPPPPLPATLPLEETPPPAPKATASAPADEARLPEGEILAQHTRDFKPGENPHPDTSGSGRWQYLASPAANPWESSQVLPSLKWAGGPPSEPRFEHVPKAPPGQAQPIQRQPGASALPSISFDEGHTAILRPSVAEPQYSVLRWTSGVEGAIIVQGRFDKLAPGEGDGLEVSVLVDGIPLYRAALAPDDKQGETFSIHADVLPGSTVDFLAGPHGPDGFSDGAGDAARLAAAIVRTADAAASLRYDPTLTARIGEAFRQTPVRPLPPLADLRTLIIYPETKLAWFRKHRIERFNQLHAEDAQPSEAALKFLEAVCRSTALIEPRPKAWELHALARQALAEGFEDPMLLSHIAAELARYGSRQDFEDSFACLQRAEKLWPRFDYGPLERAFFHMQVAEVFGYLPNRESAQRMRRQHALVAIDRYAEAARAPDLTNLDRQMQVLLIDHNLRPQQNTAILPLRHYLAARFRDEPGVDPWIRDIVLAREHHHLAWVARGGGFANSVSSDGWVQFRNQHRRARQHTLAAWQAHPELPEAAATLVSLTMADGGIAGENPRFWFDEAMKSGSGGHDAIEAYAWSLRPRWGGSHQAMLALARELLATRRFDTHLPAWYHQIVTGIKDELGSWQAALALPGVYDDLAAEFTGYRDHPKDDEARRFFHTSLAALAWTAGRQDECRKLLEELGPDVQGNGFDLFGVSYADVQRTLRDQKQPPATFFPGDPATAQVVLFASGGRQLLAGTTDGSITVWDVATKQPAQKLAKHLGPVICLEASADGRQWLSVCGGGRVVVWDAGKRESQYTLDLNLPAHAAAWTPDGKHVAVACGGSGQPAQIVLCEPGQGEQRSIPAEFFGPIGGLALSAEGASLFYSPSLAAGDREQLYVWSRAEEKVTRRARLLPSGLGAWRFSPDGKRLIAGGQEYLGRTSPRMEAVLAELHPESGEVLAKLTHLPGQVTSVAYLQDGRNILAACEDGAIVQYDVVQKQCSGVIRTRFPGLASLVLAPDESQLAAVDGRGRMHVWPLDKGAIGWKAQDPLIETNHGGGIRSMHFAAGGRALVVDSLRGGISIWDQVGGFAAARQIMVPQQPAIAMEPLADGKHALCVAPLGPHYPVLIVDLFQRSVLHRLAAEDRHYLYPAVSADGRRIALADSLGTVLLVDGETRQPFSWGQLSEHAAPIPRIVMSADGSALFSSSADGTVKAWDLPAAHDAPRPASRWTVVPLRQQALDMDLSSDKSVLSISVQDTFVLDAATGKQRFVVPGMTAAFSPDGKRLITAGGRPPVHVATIWDAQTGAKVVEMRGGHLIDILSVAFSPDSRVALTGDTRGWIRAWNARTGQELLDLTAWPEE